MPIQTKKQLINWTFEGKEIRDISQFPQGAIGFIYKITNLSKGGKYYLGRKSCISRCKKKLTLKEKALPENARKTFKVTEKESTWKIYTGSSKELNADLASGDKYEKEIIQFCFSKAELTYHETRAIACSDCMLSEDCYNFWFSAKVYKKHLLNK